MPRANQVGRVHGGNHGEDCEQEAHPMLVLRIVEGLVAASPQSTGLCSKEAEEYLR